MPISKTRLARYIAAAVLDRLLNPKRTIEGIVRSLSTPPPTETGTDRTMNDPKKHGPTKIAPQVVANHLGARLPRCVPLQGARPSIRPRDYEAVLRPCGINCNSRARSAEMVQMSKRAIRTDGDCCVARRDRAKGRRR
jgi:hypothetical protein